MIFSKSIPKVSLQNRAQTTNINVEEIVEENLEKQVGVWRQVFNSSALKDYSKESFNFQNIIIQKNISQSKNLNFIKLYKRRVHT